VIRLESLNNIRKFYTFFINKIILFLIHYNNTGGSTIMNDQIYNYLMNFLETIYDRKGESKFMQYLFNMDNPHYLTVAIYLCTSTYKHKKVNVNDLKKKLTCSDRQVDIMIQYRFNFEESSSSLIIFLNVKGFVLPKGYLTFLYLLKNSYDP